METFLNSASFIVTEKCNLACKYCFECYKRKIGPDMSEETAAKCLDFLFEQAAPMPENKRHVNVTLFGGEPLLRPELCDFIVNYGVKKREETGIPFTAGVITNGTVMNDHIELLIRRWRNKINFSIQVSIDGCRQAQDLYRVKKDGSSSFDEVAKNIPVYRDIARDFCLHGCLNKKSLPLLFESYKYFVEQFNHKTGIWFMPVHSEEWDETDVALYDDQLRQIFEYETGVLNTVSSFIPIDKLLGGCRSHPERTCGAGTNYVSFTGGGDIYPCHNFYFSKDAAPDLEDYKLGNVFDENPLANTAVLEKFSNCRVSNTDCKDCKNIACYRCIADNWRFAGDILNRVGRETARCGMSAVEYKWQQKALEWAEKNAKDKKVESLPASAQNSDNIAFVLKQMAEGLNELNTRVLKLEGER